MRFARAAVAHRCQQRLERAIAFLGRNGLLAPGEHLTILDAELDAGKMCLLEYPIVSPQPNDTRYEGGNTASLCGALSPEKRTAIYQTSRGTLGVITNAHS
jgi:hypothetical protein